MIVKERSKEERNQPARFSFGTFSVKKHIFSPEKLALLVAQRIYVLFLAKAMPASDTRLKKEIAAKAYGAW